MCIQWNRYSFKASSRLAFAVCTAAQALSIALSLECMLQRQLQQYISRALSMMSQQNACMTLQSMMTRVACRARAVQTWLLLLRACHVNEPHSDIAFCMCNHGIAVLQVRMAESRCVHFMHCLHADQSSWHVKSFMQRQHHLTESLLETATCLLQLLCWTQGNRSTDWLHRIMQGYLDEGNSARLQQGICEHGQHFVAVFRCLPKHRVDNLLQCRPMQSPKPEAENANTSAPTVHKAGIFHTTVSLHGPRPHRTTCALI